MKNNMRKQSTFFKARETNTVDAPESMNLPVFFEPIIIARKAISDLEESGKLKALEKSFNDSTKNTILDIFKTMPIFDTLPKPDNVRERYALTLSEQIIKNREENSLKITVPQP